MHYRAARAHRPPSGTVREAVSTELLIDGVERLVSWTRVTTWDYDPSYGADADGNRGVPRTDVSDDEPESVVVEIEEGRSVLLGYLPTATQKAVLAAIEDYQRQHEAEEPDTDPPDTDPYDERWLS